MLRKPLVLATRSSVRARRNGSLVLAALFVFSLLPSCALMQKQENGAALEKARAEVAPPPKEGDVKMVGGVEYIYGRNIRWLSSPEEPEYIWVRKDQYAGRLSDALSGALSRRAEDKKEMDELKKRLDRLEAELKQTDGAAGGTQGR